MSHDNDNNPSSSSTDPSLPSAEYEEWLKIILLPFASKSFLNKLGIGLPKSFSDLLSTLILKETPTDDILQYNKAVVEKVQAGNHQKHMFDYLHYFLFWRTQVQTRLKTLKLENNSTSEHSKFLVEWEQYTVKLKDTIDSLTHLPKNLIICFDGTNNLHYSQDASNFTYPTNVFKLFRALDGELIPSSDKSELCLESSLLSPFTTEQGLSEEKIEDMVKILADLGLSPVFEPQRSLYLPGVGSTSGDSSLFGYGIIPRLVWAWLWLSFQSCHRDDKITITGFSRGAYTARVFADLIATKGLLPTAPNITATSMSFNRAQFVRAQKHNYFSQATLYVLQFLVSIGTVPRKQLDALSKTSFDRRPLRSFLQMPIIPSSNPWIDFVGNWPDTQEEQSNFLKDKLSTLQLVAPLDLKLWGRKNVGLLVWDTVAALGDPTNDLHDKAGRVDHHRWATEYPHPSIKFGFHAIALDEGRIDFTPIQMRENPNPPQESLEKPVILEMMFAGCHSDVGGSYPCRMSPNPNWTNPDGTKLNPPPEDHESGLSDISLAWMVFNLHNISRGDAWATFRSGFLDWAILTESGYRTVPQMYPQSSSSLSSSNSLPQSPPNAPIISPQFTIPWVPEIANSKLKNPLFGYSIFLSPDPLGIAHLQGRYPSPRLFSEALPTRHHSIAVRTTTDESRQYVHIYGKTKRIKTSSYFHKEYHTCVLACPGERIDYLHLIARNR